MPESSYSEPFVWRPGRHGFNRLVAHVLIRLLILCPLPPQLQLGAALFPLSLVWLLGGELQASAPSGPGEPSVALADPLSERPGGTCPVASLSLGGRTNGTTQPLMLAVGNKLGLVVADPGAAAVVQRAALPDLKYGDAVLTGTVNSTSLALVGGTVQEGTGRLWVLSLAPLATGQAPTLLGMLDVPAGITDLLFLDATTVIAATDTGIAYVISLADPTNPVKTDELLGVGSSLAMYNGLLLSIRRGYISTPQTNEFGIKSKALGRVALVEGIKPKRVVVDLAKRAAESFDVKYRVIPQAVEVQSSQLELRSGDTTLLTRPALLTEGRGVVSLGVGIDLGQPGTGVRLVLNAGTPEELIGLTRQVPTARVEIQPSELVELTTDDREVEIVAYSDSHLQRTSEALAAGLPRETTQLSWEVVGSGATLSRNPSASDTGVFETALVTPQTPGATYRLQARLPGSGVVAISEPLTVDTGRARQVALSSDRSALPADGASEVTLTLSARDQFGNVLPDGTLVSWAVEGQGELHALTSTTADGTTTMTYRAGAVAGEAVITAQTGDASATTAITLAALEITVAPGAGSVVADSTSGIPVTVSATSSAGPPANAAAPMLQATLGRLLGPANLSDGVAAATFVPLGVTRPAKLWASVTTHRGEATVEVVRPSGFYVSADRPGFVGNRTEDGVATLERLDGEIVSVPYFTSSTLTVTANPGETVVLQLGDTSNPNVEPIALYPMDDLDGGVVMDEYHDHPGVVFAAGVVADYERKTTGAGSLRFDGSGEVSVAEHSAFDLGGALGLGADFRVDTAQAATLITKAGAYGLELVPDGGGVRVKAHVSIAGVGEQSVVSQVLMLGVWHSAAAVLEDGTLALSVDGQETRLPVEGVVETLAGGLTLGSNLLGNLDNVQVYDLTRPKLLSFEDGSFRTEVLVGESGLATVRIRSLGTLRNSSPNSKREAIKYWIRDQVITEHTAFVDIWTLEWWIGFWDGFISGEVESPEHFLGDVISSILIYGDARDGMISGSKVGEGSATSGDYFVLVASLIGLLTQITVVGELLSVPLKAAIKVIRRLADPVVRKAISRLYLVALRDFLQGSRQSLDELVKFARVVVAGADDVVTTLNKIGPALRSTKRLKALVQLTAKTGDARVIKSLGAAYDALGALDEAAKVRYVGDIVDVLGHQLDEVARLGLSSVPVLSHEGIVGAARFMEVTGDASKAKEVVTAFMNGIKNPPPWHPKVIDEYFSFVPCVPAGDVPAGVESRRWRGR